jgi:two-component system OmpR family response regulator
VTQTILIVDDDPHILEVIRFALERAGFATISAQDGLGAVIKHADAGPDLIILDINLPEMDGLDVCREIRKTSDVPILFLSSRDGEIDRIVGLELGGDDYVSKPFSPRELVTRVKVILKRGRVRVPADDNSVLTVSDVTLWPDQHRACYREAQILLTATEFKILKAFLSRPQLVRDRLAIINVAYDMNIHLSDRTVDSHIRHIRAKFYEAGCDSIIETVHGVGYKLGACR